MAPESNFSKRVTQRDVSFFAGIGPALTGKSLTVLPAFQGKGIEELASPQEGAIDLA
jgi:hypothetical protein